MTHSFEESRRLTGLETLVGRRAAGECVECLANVVDRWLPGDTARNYAR